MISTCLTHILHLQWCRFGVARMLLCAAIGAMPVIASAEVVVAPIGREGLDVSGAMEIFVDTTAKLTIKEVSQPGFASRFVKPDGNGRNLGRISDPVWIRFTVTQRAGDMNGKVLELRYVLADLIELYRALPDGRFEVSRAGDHVKVSEREMPDMTALLRLRQAPDTTVTHYLRYQHDGILSLAFILWDAEGLRQHHSLKMLLLGAFYGALTILMIYAASLYVASGLRAYLAYAVYVVMLMFFMGGHNGLNALLLWPEQPALTDRAAILGAFLASFGVLWFSREFLATSVRLPHWDRWLKRLQWCVVPLVASVPMLPYDALFVLVHLFALPTIVLGYATGAYMALVRHSRAGWFHLVAFTLPMIGVLLIVGRNFGWVPVGMLSDYGLQFGTLLEMVVLVVGLSDRVAILKREKETAHTASLTDQLTGLGNRAHLHAELPTMMSRCARSGGRVAVIMIDLDGFKEINDEFGHNTGDIYLQAIAARIKKLMRSHDLVVRLGGDEFLVAMEGTLRGSDVNKSAEKIRACIMDPVHLAQPGGEALSLTASGSIGLAMWDGKMHENRPVNDDDMWELLKAADQAMYSAKRSGKNRVHATPMLHHDVPQTVTT